MQLRAVRRVLLEPKPVPRLVPDRAEDPRRVVDEREVVEHPQQPRPQVNAASERIEEPAGQGAGSASRPWR